MKETYLFIAQLEKAAYDLEYTAPQLLYMVLRKVTKRKSEGIGWLLNLEPDDLTLALTQAVKEEHEPID